MVFEKTKRNKAQEAKRIQEASTPKAIYKKTRREHLREIVRLFRLIRLEILYIRKARLDYKISK